MANTKEDVNINKMYASESKISKDEFIQKYKIAENGITNEEAEEKFRRLGPNEIRQAKPKKWYNYFWESLVTPFNCILIGIALILIYTDVILAEAPSYGLPINLYDPKSKGTESYMLLAEEVINKGE